MKKIVEILVLFFCIFVLNIAFANACSCIAPVTPQEALESSTAVFTGKVVSTEVQNGVMISSGDPVTVTFDVSKIWKGSESQTIVITTAREDASCGYTFEKGKEYIVYAYGEENELGTNICTRTNMLANAQEDLQELGEGKIITDISTNDKEPKEEGNNKVLIISILVGIIIFIAIWSWSTKKKR